jgi:NADH:ubiquinone oxidoreductase subunit E
VNAARRELKLAEGEDTSEDRKFTVEKLACLGTCSMAPVVVINKKMLGKMTADKMTKELKALKKDDKK